jgi:cytochrome c
MHSLEFNKFAAAVLVAVLLAVVISKLGGIVYHVDSPEEMSYIVEVDDAEGTGGDTGAPEMTFDQVLAMADPAAGENIHKKCISCHTFDQGDTTAKQGPNLWGIVGRDVASVAGFDYSGALQDLGGTWTYERLNEFIASPRSYAPGTKMTFAGISDMTQRAELVAWLRTLSDDPVPLPEVEMDAAGAEVDGDDVGVMDTGEAASDETMEGIEDAGSDAMDSAGDAADSASDAVEGAADSASEAVENAADSASEAVENAADSVSDAVEDAADSASDAANETMDSVTGDDSSDN